MLSEWNAPVKTKKLPRVVNKWYTLPQDILDMLKHPGVDVPGAALSSNAIVPSEGDVGLKDPCDRRIEASLKRNFETLCWCLKSCGC